MEATFSFKTVDLENCVIDRRNFGGNEIQRNGRIMNNAGKRNFLLIMTPEMTNEFEDRGWKVGRFSQKDPDVEPEGFMRVNVSYFKNPQIIHYISGDVDTLLDESRLYLLDNVNMENIDMRIVAVNKQNKDGEWKKNAYVEEMWIVVTPDRFAAKYANLRRNGDPVKAAPVESDTPFDD